MPVTRSARPGPLASPTRPETRPRRRHAVAVALAAAVLAASCGSAPRSPTPVTRPPSARPSTTIVVSPVAFSRMAWPRDGDAPCGQQEPPDARHAAYTGLLKRIRAVDQRTVVFELCRGDIAFRSRIAGPSMAIQDTAWLNATAPDGTILRLPNGTGPYRLDHWDPGAEIVLARNDAYRGPPAIAPAAAIVWDPDPARRLADLHGSTVDGIDAVAPGDAGNVASNPDLRLIARVGLSTAFLGMSSRSAPFDDVRVRQAIALALDRQAVVDAAFPPGSRVATHFAPCSVPHGCVGAAWPETDPSAARDLLEEAGLPDGFATTISYPDVARDYLPDPPATAEALRAQLAGIGVVATLEPQPLDEFIATLDTGRRRGLFLLGTQARYPDVTEFLDRNLGPAAPPRFGALPRELASALAQAGSTLDTEARDTAYAAANDAVRRSVPLVPLAHTGSNVAWRADVEAAMASPLGVERFAALTPGKRGQVTWSQAVEPASVFCADEVETASLRVCAQLAEALYDYPAADAAAAPSLAGSCDPNGDFTIWTCVLRPGVRFHDGSTLDAADVVVSFAAQWDAEHPLHRGRTGEFAAFLDRFRGFLNPPLD